MDRKAELKQIKKHVSELDKLKQTNSYLYEVKHAMLVLFTEYSMDEFGMRYMRENNISCRLRQDLVNAIILKLRPRACQFSKNDIKKSMLNI